MQPILYLTTLLLFVTQAWAYINGITTSTKIFKPTAKSTYTFNFTTTTSPTTNIDFSAALGIFSVADDNEFSGAGLGNFFHNLDLVALGHSGTNFGTFAVTVPLTSDNFFETSGEYTLKAAITTAFGAAESTELRFFNATVNVQLPSS